MIKQKLQIDQIQALRTGDKKRLAVLRYILAQLQNKEIEKKGQLTDEEVVMLLRKIIKELNDSLSFFERGKRTDLVEENKTQLTIVSAYLPQEISDEELKKKIKIIIKDNRELYQKNKKAIIGLCIKQLKTQADPSRIIKVVQSL